jgi:hypothetical protein
MNNKPKRLLCSWQEFTPITKKQLQESREQNDGKIILKGILQKADTLNQNGRVYPRNILEREVENYQKYILEHRATGQCDHPDDSVVALKEVSHNIIKTWWEGNVVLGKIEILNTPNGKILQTLIEDGIKLGISSRGVGSTEKDGDYYTVQDDFQLICWDFVSEPSTPGAFMLPEHAAYMPEGKELKMNDSFYDIQRETTHHQPLYQSTIDLILALQRGK